MWRMQKRGTRPNCTVVLTETGWSHWAAVSVVLATRRWMATAGVSSCLGCFCVRVCVCVCTKFRAGHFTNSVLKLQIHRRRQIERKEEKRREGVASH